MFPPEYLIIDLDKNRNITILDISHWYESDQDYRVGDKRKLQTSIQEAMDVGALIPLWDPNDVLKEIL